MKRSLLALALLVPSLAWADYAAVINADSPTHYYSFGEKSGTSAFDNGSSNLIGTYTSTFSLNASGILGYPVNSAVSFTGGASDGYVAIGSGFANVYPSATASAGWSFEEWVYPTTTATTMGIAGASDSGSSANTRWSILILSGGTWRFRVFNTGGTCSSAYGTVEGGTVTANAWNHVVATTLGAGSSALTHMRLYINATLVSELTSFSGSLCTSTPIAAMGTTPAFFGGGANSLQGRIDEAAFFGTELTQTQVTTHYNAGLAAGADVHRYRSFTSKRDEWTRPVSFSPAIPFWMFGETRGGKQLPTDRGVYAP